MKNLIGNTPMIKIRYKYKNVISEIFVKLEYYNLTGSIKDRMAYYIINKAYKTGKLKEKMPIIEATSGNTGISFSAIGAYYNNPVYIYMPSWVSVERKKIMEMYGAHVILVSKEEGGFKKCIELADKFNSEIGGFRPNQFNNIDNIKAHYYTTGDEICNKLKNISGVVSGIGTGGTLMGISKKIKEINKDLIVCAVEPDKAPLLTSGKIILNHKIDGIGDDFVPEIVDISKIDIIYDIDDNDAINMASLLAKKLGLGVGISSGANFIGSVLLKNKIEGKVVTIFPDDNKKYISTDLSGNLDEKENWVSSEVELIDYEFVN